MPVSLELRAEGIGGKFNNWLETDFKQPDFIRRFADSTLRGEFEIPDRLVVLNGLEINRLVRSGNADSLRLQHTPLIAPFSPCSPNPN